MTNVYVLNKAVVVHLMISKNHFKPPKPNLETLIS